MRQHPYAQAPPAFTFWTRGEFVRLGVMATACIIPLLMPEHHGRQLDRGAGRPAGTAPPSSGGQVRAIRVTTLDVSAAGFQLFGDTESLD